jgi:cation diffusion facilitator family transporter
MTLLVSALTFFFSVLILVIKFWAYNKTGSQAVYSDALESVVNVLTSAVAFFAVKVAAKPVDTDHPYGHGKLEYFSSATEGGLVLMAALMIIVAAAKAWWLDQGVREIEAGLAIAGLAGALNLIWGLGLLRFAKNHRSITLTASAVHILSDVATTGGALAGLLLVKWTGWIHFDHLVGIAMAIYLLISSFRIVKQSVAGLMDQEDLTVLERLAEVFEDNIVEGVIQIHHTRVIRSGSFHHIDAHVVVPEFWSVAESHEKLKDFESAVIKSYDFTGELHLHLDPCHRKYCEGCSYGACPIRAKPFVRRESIQVAHLRSKDEPI